MRKTGIRIPGVGWRRDPLGPHFQTNFVLAQRVLQLSASRPLPNGAHRMAPISFSHAPTPAKPCSKASAQEWKDYRKAARQARLTLCAAQEISSLRQALDAEPDGAARPLEIFGDGGYTNEGAPAPTPEQRRVDDSIPWQPITVSINGAIHQIRIKHCANLLWHADPELHVQAIVEGYIQRWDIEVNFREEKTRLGVGQAQAREPHSVESVPPRK